MKRMSDIIIAISIVLGVFADLIGCILLLKLYEIFSDVSLPSLSVVPPPVKISV